MPAVPVRRTQAERRASTRLALLDAAIDCLVEEGYANLTTRRVAERAGVAQSTQMHHFPNREAFLVEALSHVAQRLATEVMMHLDLAGLQEPDRRSVILDETWRAFTSPIGQAVTQLWVAAYTEPELARAMRELERDVASMLEGMAGTLFPEQADEASFPALVDTALALFCGLALVGPVIGQEGMERRWQALKPTLIEVAAQMLDGPLAKGRPREMG